MSTTFDVIVVGLGGMGSAAAWHLAERGQRVLGLEQYTPAHDRGSSHGQSRIIRQAYFEDPAYVPLILRAYELWRELERATGRDLLRVTGGLMLGEPTSAVVAGSLASARRYNLAHDLLDAADIHQRFPPLTPDPSTVGLLEHAAGVLRVEAAVAAQLEHAGQLGAELHFGEPVVRWAAEGAGVVVTTNRGSYTAERLVVAPGAWAPELLASLALPLTVERQVQFWLEPHGGIDQFQPERFPIFIWETAHAGAFYGFPALDETATTVKVAMHHGGELCSPATIRREVTAGEVAQMQAVLADRLPALRGPCRAAVTCMYTNTPDQHFIIAPHPAAPNVVIAAGFSGHGFKFASVVGEILADLATTGATPHPIALFTPQRLMGTQDS